MKLTTNFAKKTLFSIALVAIGTGCGVVEEESESTEDEDSGEYSILGTSTDSGSNKKTPLLFEAADFKLPSDVPDSTEREMQEVLFSGYHLENDGEYSDSSDDEDDTEEEEEDNSCIEDQMDGTVFHATKSEFIYSISIDMGKCIYDDSDNTVATFEVSKWDMLIYSKCDDSDVDISHLDGKKQSEVEDLEEELPECSSGTFLMQSSSEMHGNVEYTSGDTTYSWPMHSQSRSIESNEDFEPCHFTESSDEKTADGCQNLEIITNFAEDEEGDTTDTVESHTFFNSISNNVVTPEESAWHKSGSYSIVLNNWTGEVEYSDEDTAPTFTMTSDSGTESTGTWGDYTVDYDGEPVESSLIGTIKLKKIEAINNFRATMKRAKRQMKQQ